MFSFHLGLDIDILLETLTAQIGAWLRFGTLPRSEAHSDLWVDIVKMQQLTYG